MSFISKIPIQSTLKRRRIPNAFMLFVKDQKEQLVQKCPEESMTVIGTILSKKWKAMDLDEKRVYYDKYNALKRRYEDSTALNSIKEENSMDKDLIKEISEINKTEGIPWDQKQSNKIPDDSSDFTTLLDNRPDNTKKSRHRLKSEEGKSLRNPYLIFAKEQRSSIKAGKKGHVSTILGHMWQQLDSSEKKKYVEKAKLACSELISSNDVILPDRKSKNKTKKKRRPKPDTQLYGNENGVSSSKDTAVIQDKSEKKENQVNMEPRVVDPQHPSTPLQPDSRPCPHGALPQHQQSVYNAPLRFPQSQAEMNNIGVMPFSTNIGGFYRPYFYPPDPFWMYQQAMFPHHYYPFASPYHSHCHCCIQPYHGLGESSHFRSVIYGRTSALYNPGPSAAAASPDAVNDNRDDGVSDEGSDRLVIVDDVVQPDTDEHA